MPVQTRKRKAKEADLAPDLPPKKKQTKAQNESKGKPQKAVPSPESRLLYNDFTVQGDKSKDIPCQAWPSTSASNPAAAESEPAKDTTLVFTHGAGGGISNPATQLFAKGYASATFPAKDGGTSCVLFEGTMNLQSRVKTFESVLSHLKARPGTSDRTFAVGGRSMGARAAVMVAAAHEEIRKVVCVSYPLSSPKGEMRDQILLDLPAEKEVLFVSGSGDSMCDLGELGQVMAKMEAKSTLVVVEGADHGMSVGMAGLGLKGDKKEEVISRVRSETGQIAARWVADSESVGSDWRICYDATKDEIVTGPAVAEVDVQRPEDDIVNGRQE